MRLGPTTIYCQSQVVQWHQHRGSSSAQSRACPRAGLPGLCPGLVRTGNQQTGADCSVHEQKRSKIYATDADQAKGQPRFRRRASPCDIRHCHAGGYRNINARPRGRPLHVISAMSIVGSAKTCATRARNPRCACDGRLTVWTPHLTRIGSSELPLVHTYGCVLQSSDPRCLIIPHARQAELGELVFLHPRSCGEPRFLAYPCLLHTWDM